MPENTPRWTAQIQDMIASDSSIREGLRDEDAIPLMDWGRAQAVRVAARLDSEAPDANEETAGDEASVLVRLMTTISRAAVHRHAQGDEWLEKVFKRLNKTSERLYGEGAPVMSEEEIATWIAGHAARSDGEVLRDLMARFSPPGSDAVSAEPEPPPQQQPQQPAAPLSAILDGVTEERPDSAPATSTPLSAILDGLTAATSTPLSAILDGLTEEGPDSAPATSTPPSASVDLPGRTPSDLPGRSPAPDDVNDTDPSAPSNTGDEYDQE